jgi:hypothetical protein
MNDINLNDYYYGTKRGCDIGCQPIGQKGLVSPSLLKKINDTVEPNIRFLDVLRYENELTEKEIYDFELKPIDSSIIKTIVSTETN